MYNSRDKKSYILKNVTVLNLSSYTVLTSKSCKERLRFKRQWNYRVPVEKLLHSPINLSSRSRKGYVKFLMFGLLLLCPLLEKQQTHSIDYKVLKFTPTKNIMETLLVRWTSVIELSDLKYLQFSLCVKTLPFSTSL